MKIIKLTELDLTRIHYDELINTGKGRLIPISYNDSRNGMIPLMVQLNTLYGKEIFTERAESTISVEVFLPLVGKTKKRTQDIVKILQSLDNKIITDCKSHSSTWFDGMESIKYKKMIRNYDDEILGENGALILRAIDSDTFTTRFYNEKKKLMKTEEVLMRSNCYVKSIVEIVGLWTKKDCFGLYLKPHQFRITAGKMPSITLSQYAFMKDDSDEDINTEMTGSIEDTRTDYIENTENNIGELNNEDLVSSVNNLEIKKKVNYNNNIVKNLLGKINESDEDSDDDPSESSSTSSEKQ